MNHASLFSGIGGAEIAAEWVGWENLFHCEINPFGRKVLEYWYPNSVSYEDITKTDFTPWRGRIDVLTAGFPCQPFSVAGHRKGADDDRYLWPQVVRVIRETRPAWFVGENVAGILTMVQPGEEVEVGCGASLFGEDYRKRVSLRQEYVIETICRDLEREGYEVQPFVIPACAVGAPHRRDRVWIVARRTAPDPTSHGDSRRPGQIRKEKGRPEAGLYAEPFEHGCIQGGLASNSDEHRSTPRTAGEGTERSRRPDIPQPEEWGNPSQRADGLHGLSWVASHSDSTRPQERLKTGGQPDETGIATGMDIGFERHVNGSTIAGTQCFGGREIHEEVQYQQPDGQRAYGNGCERLADYTTNERLQRRMSHDTILHAEYFSDFPTQSPVCSRDDGFPTPMDGITFSKWRQEAIKAYGNAWCPPVAYEIFRAIQQTEYESRDK